MPNKRIRYTREEYVTIAKQIVASYRRNPHLDMPALLKEAMSTLPLNRRQDNPGTQLPSSLTMAILAETVSHNKIPMPISASASEEKSVENPALDRIANFCDKVGVLLDRVLTPEKPALVEHHPKPQDFVPDAKAPAVKTALPKIGIVGPEGQQKDVIQRQAPATLNLVFYDKRRINGQQGFKGSAFDAFITYRWTEHKMADSLIKDLGKDKVYHVTSMLQLQKLLQTLADRHTRSSA